MAASKFYTGSEVKSWQIFQTMNAGVLFTVTANDVSITGIQFFKNGVNETVQFHVWSAAGALLGSGSGAGVGAAWNELLFSSPVALANGSSYVVSRYCFSGGDGIPYITPGPWPRTASGLATTTGSGTSPTCRVENPSPITTFPSTAIPEDYMTGPLLEVISASSVTRDVSLVL